MHNGLQWLWMVANGYNHGDSQPIGWDMTWYNPLEVEVWLYIEFYITGTSSEMAGKPNRTGFNTADAGIL